MIYIFVYGYIGFFILLIESQGENNRFVHISLNFDIEYHSFKIVSFDMVCSVCQHITFKYYISSLFSCDQAALRTLQSVSPSVRPPPVCLSDSFFTMFLSSYHHEIFRSYYQWLKWSTCIRSMSEVKGQGHRVKTQLNRFRTVALVWIHIWRFNDAKSLMLHRRSALLFIKGIHQLSRSHG